jgi:ASCH domain
MASDRPTPVQAQLALDRSDDSLQAVTAAATDGHNAHLDTPAGSASNGDAPASLSTDGGEVVMALSVHQPWAELIIQGRKRYEIRSTPIKKRGKIAIHAGLTIRRDACLQLGLDPDALPTCAVVGLVDIADCVPFTETIAGELLVTRASTKGWQPDYSRGDWNTRGVWTALGRGGESWGSSR